MLLDLTPDELLTTTRAVRKRLDLTRPVERGVIEECIEVAVQAPTAGNRQGWHWMVVDDPPRKLAIAELYRRHFDQYIGLPDPRYREGDVRAARMPAVRSSSAYLRDHLHEVPVLVIPCAWGRLAPDADLPTAAGFWGSILPAAWSFQLALRTRGLGSAWTTLHLGSEREVAELLRIPSQLATQVALFPVAYTKGTDFQPAPRVPLDKIVHWNSW